MIADPQEMMLFGELHETILIVAYLGIAFWLRIGDNKYINLIADNTYSIMMNQFLGFMIVKTIIMDIIERKDSVKDK